VSRRAQSASGARRPLTTRQKVGIGGVATLIAFTALGVVAGVLLNRLIDFDDVLDAGGAWDDGTGVRQPWPY
jgi:hypothetical protein